MAWAYGNAPPARMLWLSCLLVTAVTACALPAAVTPSAAPSSTPAPSAAPTTRPTGTASPTAAPSATATPTATDTATPLPTATFTQTPVPTYVALRGEVIIDQAVCHYGPGAPYLYLYGVYKGSHMQILRRIKYGNYIEVQAIGGNNPCWVREDYFEVEGNLQNVQPVDAEEVKLPQSPYYGPLTGVSARRDGDKVTVFWHPLALKAGDDSEQTPYIVEAWVCQGGEFVFKPVGSYNTAVEILDETDCEQTSHADVVAAEKHGYTRRVEVPWP